VGRICRGRASVLTSWGFVDLKAGSLSNRNGSQIAAAPLVGLMPFRITESGACPWWCAASSETWDSLYNPRLCYVSFDYEVGMNIRPNMILPRSTIVSIVKILRRSETHHTMYGGNCFRTIGFWTQKSDPVVEAIVIRDSQKRLRHSTANGTTRRIATAKCGNQDLGGRVLLQCVRIIHLWKASSHIRSRRS
jgi:hypothetical protein